VVCGLVGRNQRFGGTSRVVPRVAVPRCLICCIENSLKADGRSDEIF
jgi:hypothetical protein